MASNIIRINIFSLAELQSLLTAVFTDTVLFIPNFLGLYCWKTVKKEKITHTLLWCVKILAVQLAFKSRLKETWGLAKQSPVWSIMCALRLRSNENPRPHWGHRKGFSALAPWTARWALSCSSLVKVFLQCLQLRGCCFSLRQSFFPLPRGHLSFTERFGLVVKAGSRSSGSSGSS